MENTFIYLTNMFPPLLLLYALFSTSILHQKPIKKNTESEITFKNGTYENWGITL